MINVLVTGGTGLVGSAIRNISEEYPNYNFTFVSSAECNLCNFSETYLFFTKHKPDIVIHLAAYVGGLFKNMQYKVEFFEKNFLMNSLLLS